MAEPEDIEPSSPTSLRDEIENVVENVRIHTLDDMPGHFSRLIYLASLRDHNTGRYTHYGLECRFSGEAVNEGLRLCHARVFQQVIALPLREQTEDLINFFGSLQTDRSRLVDVWRRLRAYEVLPPEDCHPFARELFSKNVGIILRILKETELWELLGEPHGDAHHLP